MNDLISVIIPAYNVEKYIERCVISVLSQSYKNIEVIVIDDGSKDSTPIILDEMAEKDNRLIVVHKKNEGVSCARNLGLYIAKGIYVAFVDSDDRVEERMLEILYDAIQQDNTDMAVCGFNIVYDSGQIKQSFIDDRKHVVEMREYLCRMSSNGFSSYYMAIWNKLYKRECIEKNELRFDESVSIGEDYMFTMGVVEGTNSVSLLQNCLYNYYSDNENSLTKSQDSWKYWNAVKHMYEYFTDKYKKMGLYEEYGKYVVKAIGIELLGPTYSTMNNKELNKEEKIEKLKEIYSSEFECNAIMSIKKPNVVEKGAIISIKKNNFKYLYWIVRIRIILQKILRR